MTAICGGCNDSIQDQYMFNVLDKSWHENCLKCHDCLLPQTQTCFYRDGLILCRTDFTRRFGTRCAGCNMVIEKEDLVRRARDLIFHVRCFQCAICQKTLDTGEQLFALGGNRFICKDDYLSSSVGSEECGSTDDLDDECHEVDDEASNDAHSSPRYARASSNQSHHLLDMDGGASGNESLERCDENSLSTKRRGPRTTIKSKQLETLKSAFAATPKPTRHMREQLAAETGLNMRVIQVWFQNRRSKERRMKQTRLSCGFRPSRRNRGSTLRNDEINSVFCDIIDPMQQQPGNFGYNSVGIPHQISSFFAPQTDIYSSLQSTTTNGIDSISMPINGNENSSIISSSSTHCFINPTSDATTNNSVQQLEALAAAVHVSSSEYNIDDVLLHSSTVLGGGASQSLTAPVW